MKRFLFFTILSALLFVGGYIFFKGAEKNVSLQGSNAKLSVVTSFYPLYFFAQQIGGDKAVVTNIVPAGAEPHDYEPTAQDMARMEKSDLIILNGGGFEAWSDRIEQNIRAENTVIVMAGEGLMTREMSGEDSLTTDPHVWLDPWLAQRMVYKIVRGFVLADPTNTAYYEENASTLAGKLGIWGTIYQRLEDCPEKNIITSHSAFGYLAAEYGLNQVSIAGLSPDAEPSPSELARIAQFAKTNNVQYIFFESLASPKLSQTIATEVGAKTLVLNPLEGLSDDELARGEDYFSVMYNNLVNLQTALQCNQ